MTKKKPDFLRDLDTAIMDELTGGGIKGNAAGLVGTLTQIKEIKQLCGLPFCGYMAKLETVRPSGVPDEVTVVFAEDVPYRACNGIEFDVMQEFVEGSRLLLTGKVQTLKDFQSGRLLVYILADFVAVSEKAVEQDEAAVRGVIANKPTYRENATMKTGDVIEINTKYGSKGAKLIRDGVETDYFRYIDVDSTFMQLAIGDNMFRYDAASGVNSLEVSIFYSKEFLGV